MLTLFGQSWWTLALRGAIAVLFGIIALIWPGATLLATVIMFGSYSLMDGILMIVMSVRDTRAHRQWWVLLLGGLVGLGAGIAALVWPSITAVALLYIIAAWAMVTGVLEIVVAILLRKEIQGEWVLIARGLLSLLFGLAMAIWPGAGALAVIWWIGGYAIVVGVLSVVLAFTLRGRFKALRQEFKQAFDVS
jgi:uncharacterized membrane protein HdeD (DUF308 family)